MLVVTRTNTALLLRVCCMLVAASFLFIPQTAEAAFVGPYAPGNFTLTNTNADGFIDTAGPGLTLLLLGGLNGSGEPGTTDLIIPSVASGLVSFHFEYLTADDPDWDSAGYLLNGLFTQLATASGVSGNISFMVATGDLFGFRVATADNLGFRGELYISEFVAPLQQPSAEIPEPSAWMLAAGGLVIILSYKFWMKAHRRSARRAMMYASSEVLLLLLLCGVASAQQQQQYYAGSDVTGRLQIARTVNATQVAQNAALRPLGARIAALTKLRDFKPREPLLRPDSGQRSLGAVTGPSSVPVSQMLGVSAAPPGFGFNSLSHYDQRNASRGNQYSLEPPNESVAVGNGFVLVGVNNAVAIYDMSGTPLLPVVLSSNELFGVAPAIVWDTGINGPYPTDMRVFFDQSINRWFVLQRAQDYNIFGDPQQSSRIYMAVSQTANPLGNYTVYEMNTTNAEIPGCPCFSDYPQIGADQYGFYISVNEFSTFSSGFVTASILAISKSALATSAAVPTVYKFIIPRTSGFEFTIHPTSTPPGASYFSAAGGLQFFVSTNTFPFLENSVGLWAMYNTSSLNTQTPQPVLVQTAVSTTRLIYPDLASQKPGPTPYGSSLGLPLSYIDGGDNRVQSAVYAGGRIYLTVASQVQDDLGFRLVGAAYVVLAPVFRGGVVSATVVRQGYVAVRQNHLLRPAIAVNAQGKGAIAVTLVGPNYYPSAAYIPVDSYPTGSLYLAAAGTAPQDGFTGYEGYPARWGDYSTATIAPDGSTWMIMQYIPVGPRTEFANWGTYVRKHIP